MLCIFHSADLDGHCSAAIVKWTFPEATLYGWNYGDLVPWDLIHQTLKEGQDLVIVDLSLPGLAEYQEPFASHMEQIYWIDHHVSALQQEHLTFIQDEGKKLHNLFHGKRNEGKAGCELTWEYLYPLSDMPDAVRLLGRYDVWDHEYSSRVLPFQYGMRMNNTYPSNTNAMGLWIHLFELIESELFEDIVENGEVIQDYQYKLDRDDAKKLGFMRKLDGLKVFAINRQRANSKPFRDEAIANGADAICSFVYSGDGRWRVSLYDTDKPVDLSDIAKARGGGGHAGAAGFETDELPFLPSN